MTATPRSPWTPLTPQQIDEIATRDSMQQTDTIFGVPVPVTFVPLTVEERDGLIAALRAQPEVCVCAAVQLADGYIVRGHRHHDCLRSAGLREEARAKHEGRDPSPVHTLVIEQGFMTTRNRFVNRQEGAALQVAAGLPVTHPDLYSEDLY